MIRYYAQFPKACASIIRRRERRPQGRTLDRGRLQGGDGETERLNIALANER